MRNEKPLQENLFFEKMRFKHSVELSKQVFEMMVGGKKVFPNEGISELQDYIDRIKHSTVFSMKELSSVFKYDGIDKELFPEIGCLKAALEGYRTSDGVVTIQDETISYEIPRDLLDAVNAHYDGKDLMEVIGGILHQKPMDREYRKKRYAEIYGG